MKHLINTADELLKQLKALQPLKPEDQARLDRKFRLEFNYNSNHLEGNTLTYSETELLLIFEETKGSHSKRELDEMQAHDVAYQLIQDWADDEERPLSEQHIKNLNEIILVRPYWKDAITPDGQKARRQIKVGDYKEYPNSVLLQNGEIFNYTSPAETPIEMGELISWYRSEERAVHRVTLAAMLHYKFVRIHPFDDGNGRISRLLMNYVLLRSGYPPVIIKSGDKANYLRALHLADVGDYGPFIDYVAEQLIWSLEVAIKAAKGESIEELGDFEKRLSLFKKKAAAPGKVTMKYGKEAFGRVLNDVLYPLVEKWEGKLQELDVFFLSRSVSVFFDSSQFHGTNAIDILHDNAQNKIMPAVDRGEILPRTIRITCAPKGIVALHGMVAVKSVGLNGGELKVNFYENAFEIEADNLPVSMTFIYGEEINVDWRDEQKIVEALASFLLTNLENYLESTKP